MTQNETEASGTAMKRDEDEVMQLAFWRGGGVNGTKHKITAQPNGAGWLILKQSKTHKEWRVDESWHSDERPRLIGGDRDD